MAACSQPACSHLVPSGHKCLPSCVCCCGPTGPSHKVETHRFVVAMWQRCAVSHESVCGAARLFPGICKSAGSLHCACQASFHPGCRTPTGGFHFYPWQAILHGAVALTPAAQLAGHPIDRRGVSYRFSFAGLSLEQTGGAPHRQVIPDTRLQGWCRHP